MRKLFEGFLPLMAVVALCGCSASASQETTVKAGDNAVQTVEVTLQNVTDITTLATPDKLVYLHDGVETVYQPHSETFQEIIQLNNARQTNTLGVLKQAVDYNEVAKQGDYLIYQYTKAHYAHVYFSLVPSPDERFENWVMNHSSNNISLEKQQNPSTTQPHGQLAPADELLIYLKSQL